MAENIEKIEDYDEAHGDILELFKIAEELVATVEDPNVLYHHEQIEVLEPLVDEVIECADDLSVQFCEFSQATDKKTAAKAFKLRRPFQRIFKAVNDCLEGIKDQSAEVAENIATSVMPKLEKLVRHTERVFSRLAVIVENARDVVRRRKEFYDLVTREAHIANLVRQNANNVISLR